MGEADAIWREVILIGVALGFGLYLIGGFLTRVAGSWADADAQTMTLHQFGPWVRGVAVREGGHQRFRGWALWGRVGLDRYDFGAPHLVGLGFSEEQAAQMEGRLTGNFKLRLVDGTLTGEFYGRKFSFANDKVTATRAPQGAARVFRRTRQPQE